MYRLAEGARHLLQSAFEHLLGPEKRALRTARAQRHSELAKMAQAYIDSHHAVAGTLRGAPARARPGYKQPRRASQLSSHRPVSHRAAPRHLLSEQSEHMAETWRSYFQVSEDMEKHVTKLQALITRIKAPGLLLVSVFKSLPPAKAPRPEE